MSTVTETKPKEEQKPALSEREKWLASLEDDDLVVCIRRNWGTPLVPMDKVDYLDTYTSVGGVIRNVPYEVAKKWIKRGSIAKGHIFPPDAQADAFSEATGRNPLAPENLAAAVATLSPEKIAGMLGDEAAIKLAKEVQRYIANRKKEGQDGTA